jgi:hypothetical protein
VSGAIVFQPVNPELYVIVSIFPRKKGGRPIVHVWGEGLVVDNGTPYTSKQKAQSDRRKAIRDEHRHRNDSRRADWFVCKVLGSEASYVDELGIGRAI